MNGPFNRWIFFEVIVEDDELALALVGLVIAVLDDVAPVLQGDAAAVVATGELVFVALTKTKLLRNFLRTKIISNTRQH